MRAVLSIWRRELAGYFHAPIAYVVGVLFLVIQGLSFWTLVEVLSDPARPAPYGAVLSGYFGGSVMFWAVLFLVVAVLAMRLVAEEKRQGTWELLLTTPVDVRQVLVGKWLGALSFYAMLWAPTALYLVVLARYAPDGASFDGGPVVAAYLGVLLAGAGFLAVGVAASAATANQIVAAVSCFVILLVLLVVGQLPELAPSWMGPTGRTVAAWIDVRGHLDRFARGAVELGPVAFYLGLAAAGLALASALAAVGRRRRGEVGARLLAAALVGAICLLGNIVVQRNPRAWDLTRARVNSLDPATARVLDRVDRPIELLVIPPGEPAFDDVWRQVDRVVDRMLRRQPLLVRRDVDPSLEPERMVALAREFGISGKDLVDYGAVVVQAGDRRRVVDLIDVAEVEPDELGVGSIGRLHAEEAIGIAIAEVSSVDRPIVCATGGHGELPPRPEPSAEADWSALAARLEREGMVIEEVGALSAGVPSYCRVVAMIGPRLPLSPDEVLAVDRYLAADGRLLLVASALLDPRDDPPRLPATGLELVLDGYGLSLPQAIAVDPDADHAVGRLPGAFRVVSSYGDHPISAPYRGRRFTVWQLPRVVEVAPPDGVSGGPLVETSAAGWGETDLARVGASTSPDGADLAGPVAIAAAVAQPGRGRIAVFGSARSLSSALIDRGLGAGDALAADAVTWLVGRERQLGVGDKTPEQLRLVMTDGERAQVFVLCVVLIPLGFAAAGGIAWWRRRRG
jgi:ABC-2 type transport system permease protein